MEVSKTLELNNGLEMPTIGFGTWQSKPNEVKEAVKVAIDTGYRYLDCAYLYLNETEVGEAIRDKIQDGTVKREDLFICSKLWSNCHSAQDVLPALQESLDMLGVSYVDLYLIHWPIAFQRKGDAFPRDANGELIYVDTSYLETWNELEKAYEKGLVKALGLSNFNSKQIQEVIDNSKIKPSNLQQNYENEKMENVELFTVLLKSYIGEVEIHPYLSQQKLVNFCHERNISVTAYSPLGSPARPWDDPKPQPLLEHADIVAVGTKYNKSPAQVIIRWLLQRRIIPIPKSVTPSRIKENIEVYDFQLTADDMGIINKINRNLRLVTYGNGTTDIVPSAPFFPFNEEY